ncbi:MAG: KUP/HAK/KT family potassium transporter [Gammaproteobacteria bacterium]
MSERPKNGEVSESELPPGQEAQPATRALPFGAAAGAGREPLTPAIGLAVLGVVFGDIGTSPIYALRECFHGFDAIATTPANVLGVLSLMFWALLIVISLKYVTFILQANNRGEGGIFALLALLRPWHDMDRRRRWLLIMLGLFGASLLYGDVMITPAISILSAVEGLAVATPALSHYVVPITVGILVALFVLQHRGTARVGALFGPIIVIWMLTLAVLGITGIVSDPGVLAAVNPMHGWSFLIHNGWAGFVTLASVFLVVTGGEALYADLGHFGRRPIRRMWFGFVLPSLLLNYFGQGALLLVRPEESLHPFYDLAPAWGLYPLVVIATAATIIASQAAITGAFSLTSQAVQLRLFPPVSVLQTSPETRGQIYVPAVNWLLMFATIGLVLGFRSSSGLAGAYGVSVNSTMAITTILAFNVALTYSSWGWARSLLFLVGFLAVDLAFLGANLTKVEHGGWFPIGVGILFFTLLSTWRRGTELLSAWLTGQADPLQTLLGEIAHNAPQRVPGTAVFITPWLKEAPPTLRHHLRRNRSLHKQVILLNVLIQDVPKVPADERIELEHYEQGFWRVILNYGFMQTPNIPSELARCHELGLDIDLEETTYYLGYQTVLPSDKRRGMAPWRDRVFAFMARNAANATTRYQIPAERVVEIGFQVRI